MKRQISRMALFAGSLVSPVLVKANPVAVTTADMISSLLIMLGVGIAIAAIIIGISFLLKKIKKKNADK